MDCAVCGEAIKKNPIWVQLGDKGERPSNEKPFALHPEHYPKGGKVKVAEWGTDENGEPKLREFETQRYVRVEGP